ncbi:MAG: cobaltochelatase subunit CobN [Deltaproteobacteria bacterium]|nr:cobaltochelatase subunit CobN [Deltaproteobacteria bacterium]
MWGSYVPVFLEATRESFDIKLDIFSQKELENDMDLVDDFLVAAEKAHIILLYRTSDGFWPEVSARLDEIAPDKVIVTTSFDPSDWGRNSTVDISICARAYTYLAEGGKENYRRLLEFLAHQVDPEIPVQDPLPMPWQGILHPPDQKVYASVEEYRKAHPSGRAHTVGLLFSRHSFTNTDASLERSLIEALEARGFDVLPVFSHGTPDQEAGSLGPIESCRRFFIRPDGTVGIDALVNLQFFFLGREARSDISETGVAAQSVNFFRELNVPVFKPVVSYSKTVDEWEEDPQGLTMDVTFGIAMPEFEGNIEPILMACSRKLTDEKTGSIFELREVIKDRVEHIAERIARFVRLAEKPICDRKAVFVLHKNECAGLEAGVGGAAGLDSGESIVQIMRSMKEAGYRVERLPVSGESLMQTILSRKAIAEFRWTTVDEIVSKGGHLALLDNAIYREWFDSLPQKAKRQIVHAWGEPPGRKMNGVPPSMVYDGKLVITGLNFGNINIIMQPKRGCAGARCDGRVCKILHDPDIPPPHQYIATYMYMDKVFGADVIIHVGTHGNLEWLPGKGAGLSSDCWPDIAIGAVPHLYIYNADNPAEGVIAKRRSYAVLVDHLQAVMNTADTYGGFEELEELLEEYNRASNTDPARAHQLEHLIREVMEKTHLTGEVEANNPANFSDVVKQCHQIISGIKNSQTRIGMHVFGEVPEDMNRAETINTILRFDSNNELNTRRLVFDLWGEDMDKALDYPADRGKNGKTYSDLLFLADRQAVDLIHSLIRGFSHDNLFRGLARGHLEPACTRERFERFAGLVTEIDQRLTESREIDSLLSAMDGGYVPAGPSGYLSRGRYDILPTGRNFYNVDPTRIPTRAAYRVGVRLAEALLERFLKDEEQYPESVGMVWLASDIMRADGEQIGQILHLLGVRPRWKGNGQVDGIEIIPPVDLGRPRIDVNIRVSGITRDCFPGSVKYVDQAIQAVAVLEEKPEENFIRKHILEQAREENAKLSDPETFRRLSFRIFCAQPGVYRAGVDLAVYASAWKTEADISDVYFFWNGYAYGGGAGDAAYGVQAHKELVANLRRVEAIFDKHISDEGDFLSCCGYFSNYGGMSVAAKTLSGKRPRNYYGDTRDPARVGVTDFADEMRRVVRAKLLNPKYIKGMKEHGYKGAGDLSKRIGRVYGFAATTGEVDNWILDEITETFVLNEEMRRWFKKVNPWALEEIGRRLLEAASRGIWQPDEERLEQLKEAYLEVEGSIEDTMGEVTGEFQGGSVDVMTADDIEDWKVEIGKVLGGLGLKHEH